MARQRNAVGESRLRVIHVSSELGEGGAFRAKNRIMRAVSAVDDSKLDCLDLRIGTQDVAQASEIRSLWLGFRIFFGKIITKSVRLLMRVLIGFSSKVPISLAIFGFGWNFQRIKETSDIIHLHWIGDLGPSIRQISRLSKPTVWTLHDMWPFLGIDRFTEGIEFRDGYQKLSINWGRARNYVNRIFFSAKVRLWKRSIFLVAPSRWMMEQALSSPITKDWPVEVIPIPLDTDFWAPGSKSEARELLRLDNSRNYLLFGAVNFYKDPNKGFEEMKVALEIVAENSRDFGQSWTVLTFGSSKYRTFGLSAPCIDLGTLDDDLLLHAYRASDVMVVPSRIESFGQTASEAASTGLPVVAFGTSGLFDVIEDGVTGFLAEPRSALSLSEAILRLISDSDLRQDMGRKARERACRLWALEVVGRQYHEIYKTAERESGGLNEPR